ncbi:MAG: hypothetical protein LBS20_11050 [Prevotella sp.]|jgi:hypothetical protein|nr:hypothetical protein [Prevotella sp.]
MKKYLIVSVISVLSLGSFIVSCSKDKDDDDKKICTCSVWEDDGSKQTESISLEDAKKEYGVNSCADLEDMLMDEYYDATCKG